MAASPNTNAAWSRDIAALFSCEFQRASGPQRCKSSKHAASAVFPFFRPNEMIAVRVPAGLS
ncbi:hypothetical protein GL4_1468 [Methyloceanibacter caenitepidi]|uniref:Uncharacterized protein n=1 Tax=Methyloceanibacter caenitepidi TaxID=1384459 RepID=A0A0A8K4K9_9HYPH|nr:hypothetical protein GL4_1468 [Methyloceanibacter caenitepidi]